MGTLQLAVPWEPAEPLWRRMPTHDEHGRFLYDLMMIVPKLCQKPNHMVQETVKEIEDVLRQYERAVVFADFNLKINTLLVSLRPIDGIRMELCGAIQARVPEALVVADLMTAMFCEPQRPKRPSLLRRLLPKSR